MSSDLLGTRRVKLSFILMHTYVVPTGGLLKSLFYSDNIISKHEVLCLTSTILMILIRTIFENQPTVWWMATYICTSIEEVVFSAYLSTSGSYWGNLYHRKLKVEINLTFQPVYSSLCMKTSKSNTSFVNA